MCADPAHGKQASNLLQPSLPSGTPVNLDVYLAHAPGHYGHHLMHMEDVMLGKSNRTMQRTAIVPPDIIAQVRLTIILTSSSCTWRLVLPAPRSECHAKDKALRGTLLLRTLRTMQQECSCHCVQ